MVGVSGLSSITISRAIWFYPGLDSIPFNAMTPMGGVSVPGNTTNLSLVSFTIPNNSWGILKGFGITTAVTAGFSNLEWTVRINQIPIPGYANFCDQISTLVHLNYLFKKVEDNDIIEIVASNTSSTAYVTYARLVGWYQSGSTIAELDTQLDTPMQPGPGAYILYKIDLPK